jgi:hypothetical protein
MKLDDVPHEFLAHQQQARAHAELDLFARGHTVEEIVAVLDEWQRIDELQARALRDVIARVRDRPVAEQRAAIQQVIMETFDRHFGSESP